MEKDTYIRLQNTHLGRKNLSFVDTFQVDMGRYPSFPKDCSVKDEDSRSLLQVNHGNKLPQFQRQMTDEILWDPDWWKKQRDASLERQQAEASAVGEAKLGDTFLIVTEGTVTEPIYFELLLGCLELSRVAVLVIPGPGTDPRAVIEMGRKRAHEQVRLAEKGQLGVQQPPSFDHVWAVVDTDVATRQGLWNDVVQLAKARNVKLAYSTPCFEFWLLLHLLEHPTTRGDLENCGKAKAAVKHELGRDYSTNENIAREAIGSFVTNWPRAVSHAEHVLKQHKTAATPKPANPSTEVGRLARALNDSAPKHLRKL